ncbi:uncharacterized protein BcabD6B2_20120 [Babesia caballi]|uniref:Uncharacterized protein n=1 Tax=Babesia caballi TaxID=5871 RepID=A0AAV4LSH6_BABCB|nr:hypothetical protein, conserved [Babesia caballi]
MPLCTIDDFEREVLILDEEDVDSNAESDAPYAAAADRGRRCGIFVFYQNDVDGLCALFILEHHKRLSYGLRLTSYPVVCEADIYSYIKKNISIRASYPDVDHEGYLRVVLLGIHGWDPQVLYAVKIHFSQQLPEERRNDLKICVVPATRPLHFFNVSFEADWYFFVANDQEVELEKANKERQIAGGIYVPNSVAAIIASVTQTIHEASRAAILYASAVAVISRMEHSGTTDATFNSQITKIFQEISVLDGGPYIQYDADRATLPLVSFMSMEEALKVSPYVFMHDPMRKKDTLAQLRIRCNLLMEEFTSEFCNLDPKRQSQVLRQVNGHIKRIDRSQLLWLRRTSAMPCVDMIYILIAISVGWLNKENAPTADTAPIIASDFMYNTLSDRMSQESFYDKVIMTQLTLKASQLLRATYDMIAALSIKSRVFGVHKVLFTTLYPKHVVEHINELRLIGFLVSSVHARGNPADGLCRVLLFVRNPNVVGTAAFGYSPEVTAEFPDIWALVFRALANDDPSYVYDLFRPTCVEVRSDDLETAKRKIAKFLRIALEGNLVSYLAESDEDSFVGTDDDYENGEEYEEVEEATEEEGDGSE